MKIVKNNVWTYYIGDDSMLDDTKCGKWMYFYDDIKKAKVVCKRAVEDNIVYESKHSNKNNDGVACFYLNADDMDNHKRVIQFFLDNNLIPKTKSGRYYNISFKLDSQTHNNEYGSYYKSNIRLEDFIDLNTGEWKNQE